MSVFSSFTDRQHSLSLSLSLSPANNIEQFRQQELILPAFSIVAFSILPSMFGVPDHGFMMRAERERLLAEMESRFLRGTYKHSIKVHFFFYF